MPSVVAPSTGVVWPKSLSSAAATKTPTAPFGYSLTNPTMTQTPSLGSKVTPAPAGGASSVPNPSATPGVPSSTPPSSSTSNNAPAPASLFNLTSDPVLQQVMAQMQSANSTDQAQALSQEEQALLSYGDPALASAVLGSSDPIAAAIANNPQSQLAQLAQQNQEQQQNFIETLDPSLVNSGYRVQQQGLLNQNYQNALAQAASGIQGTLQGIQGNLSSEEAANQNTLTQAISDAYNRALASQLATPTATSDLPAQSLNYPQIIALMASLGQGG